MAEKRRSGSSGMKWIKLALLATNIFNFVTNLTTLIRFEAHAASKSFVTLIIGSLFATVLLSCSWLCLLTMLCIYLLSLHWSLLSAIAIAFLLNVILLLVVFFVICKTRHNLFFPIIREQFRDFFEE